MAIRHSITLSTTEPNNEVGVIKIRQADEQTQTLEVQITENGVPKSYQGLAVYFCAKLGQTAGLGIIEQKLKPEEMTSPANGKLEYTMRAEDWQVLGRQKGYFSFRKMKNEHEFVEQFTTRDFTFDVIKSVYSDGLKEVKKDGSTYIWTIEEMLRLFNEYMSTGKINWDNYKDTETANWEYFVEQNRETLESADPGGKIIRELIDARNPEGANTPYPDLKTRLDIENGETSKKAALLKQALDNMSNLSEKELIASDYFASGANVLATTETKQKWETLSGAFSVTNGKVFSNATGTWSKAVVETYSSNVEISFAVRSFEGHPRIVFRAKDTNNYWFFGIANQVETNLFVLAKIKDGEITEVDRIPNNWDLKTSIGSRMRVIVNGNNIKCYINNYLMFDKIVSNDFISETKHGISLYGAGGELNAFKIGAIEKINYPDNLIASVDNKLVSYDGNHLLLSEDGGRSYKKGISIQEISIIKHIHLFGDGKLLFADHKNVYYTHDWKTYHKSTVYNADGSIFIPDEYDNFSCYKNGTVKKIVAGKELAVWGNYSTAAEVEFTDKIKVWSTSDYGKTVRAVYVCNTPGTVKCRHIHAVDFNPSDQTFWLQTGDEPVGGTEMSHWVKGEYTLSTDSWVWIPFASGEKFKTTNMIFHANGYVYFSWDLTPGGAVKAPIATMGDVSTHQLLLRTNKDCHFLIVGPSGDIAVFQTAWGGEEQPRVFYYAPDGINFSRIYGSLPLAFDQVADAQYQTYWPINSQGKVLAGVQSLAQQNIRDWTRKPSVFIDEILKDNGFPNAFK